ncbi:IucA/IucC family C-terminal-domain containing protein [Bacillus sp. EB01]|uniref:IucA/IucC family C-terminal-domain containing protein n=1 Tax=Bacillus sp. EB01 TaxID=1347086 RepID=UPI0006938FF1|nr:IucA/IucC family C-terminal-domain containing protein [Bacillus sp. EB01]
MKLETRTQPLTIAEKTKLKAYRYTDMKKIGMIQASSLLDHDALEAFIESIMPTLQTDSAKVAASVFMKRYAYIAVLSLYSISALNKKLNIQADNVFFEAPIGTGSWLPKFFLEKAEAEKWDGGDHNQWRKQAITELFAGHIFPLIDLLGKVTGVSKLILWENVAIYIMWLYESELAGQAPPDDDFNFIFNETEGAVFGKYRRNPLTKFFTEKTYQEDLDEMVRVRKTCCFSYLTGDKDKRCKTCPCRQLEMEGKCANGTDNICEAVRSIT